MTGSSQASDETPKIQIMGSRTGSVNAPLNCLEENRYRLFITLFQSKNVPYLHFFNQIKKFLHKLPAGFQQIIYFFCYFHSGFVDCSIE